MLLALLACAEPDPQAEAWEHAFEITRSAQLLDACEGEAVEFDRVEKYLFVAVDRGTPDLATPYYCHATDDCDDPVTSIWVTDLTVDHLAGNMYSGDSAGGSLCTVRWNDVDASLDGKDLTMRVRVGSSLVDDVAPDACGDLGEDWIGEECDAVLELTGTLVE